MGELQSSEASNHSRDRQHGVPDSGEKFESFRPFYLRAAQTLDALIGLPLIGPVVISVVPGAVVLAVYYSVDPGSINDATQAFDGSFWLVGVICIAAQACLYHATQVYNGILAFAREHWQRSRPTPLPERVPRSIEHYFKDRLIVGSGVLFGVVNVSMGLTFGVPYAWGARAFATVSGYFVVGFICGMAAWGIYLASSTTRRLVLRRSIDVDIDHKDRCGGLREIGDAYGRFALVTTLIAVLISAYILWTHWSRPNVGLVLALKISWLAWPCILALTVFFGPLIELGRAISAKRLACLAKLATDQRRLEADRDQTPIGTTERTRLEALLEGLRQDRERIATVSAFPLSKSWVPKSIAALATHVLSSSVAMERQFPNVVAFVRDMLGSSV